TMTQSVNDATTEGVTMTLSGNDTTTEGVTMTQSGNDATTEGVTITQSANDATTEGTTLTQSGKITTKSPMTVQTEAITESTNIMNSEATERTTVTQSGNEATTERTAMTESVSEEMNTGSKMTTLQHTSIHISSQSLNSITTGSSNEFTSNTTPLENGGVTAAASGTTLEPGSIAGIVVAAVVIVIAISVAFFLIMRDTKKARLQIDQMRKEDDLYTLPTKEDPITENYYTPLQPKTNANMNSTSAVYDNPTFENLDEVNRV
ncbi:unnamed protein product, partial [Owenia fusiformis]